MGQRGPAPQPIALRVLKGETRPSQLNAAPRDQEPPRKPEGMDAAAGKTWDRVLSCTSHIGEKDADTLRHYCELVVAIAAWPKGSKEWRDLVNLHRMLARELCLTPATGGNLGGKVKAEEPKLAKYLKPA